MDQLRSAILEAPENGKACFKERYEREIVRIKARYPEALYPGIAYDGAKDKGTFLTPHTDQQLLGFYHVTEYLARASDAVHPQKKAKLHGNNGCQRVVRNSNTKKCGVMPSGWITRLPATALSDAVQEGLEATTRYFKYNIAEQHMDYAHHN